jgi:hypothetical protein
MYIPILFIIHSLMNTWGVAISWLLWTILLYGNSFLILKVPLCCFPELLYQFTAPQPIRSNNGYKRVILFLVLFCKLISILKSEHFCLSWFWNRVLLYSSVWPQIHDSPASASPRTGIAVLGHPVQHETCTLTC